MSIFSRLTVVLPGRQNAIGPWISTPRLQYRGRKPSGSDGVEAGSVSVPWCTICHKRSAAALLMHMAPSRQTVHCYLTGGSVQPAALTQLCRIKAGAAISLSGGPRQHRYGHSEAAVIAFGTFFSERLN